ncbi:uncharacterized protein si:dkey-24l11.2 [Corythoichthys intestinalis]|uniref:uncharacterized protein si:dkey-24l11.2 n=1 Tax=Corythoichthys intestinalis TaxID=161448 RepID=UPI0025A4F1F1|nr:uncharacterized protein si:dkey-24l11.2 [Corythoichthys intestinalis]XP_057693772.1 uncharacterized protein si:dkey-24l11.2 [Corythoichthys intestinalis]XP_061812802.1 uncharacterized protein LOC133603557 [Nerophis lumbriciformis]
METCDGGEICEPKELRQTQKLCRFFSQGRRCNFGAKCRYLHIRVDLSSDHKEAVMPSCQADIPSADHEGGIEQIPLLIGKPRASSGAGRRACRYFLSGYCTMEDRCRFWHPPQLPSLGGQVESNEKNGLVQKRAPAPRPNVLQEVKLCELTEDVIVQLRDTEIKQLKKRFPKDRLITQERSDGKVTYYRATVEATDPDWPFDLKEIDIMVSFPETYPQEIFTLDIPLDQELPRVMGRHVQQSSLEWLQAKHATNQLLGKVELLFRPFLRWLDRSLEKLFTEGARLLKKDIAVEKAGLQFIPYQDLQATVCEKTNNSSCETNSDTVKEEEETGNVARITKCDIEEGVAGFDEKQRAGDDDEEATHLVENIKISEVRRGTEVRLLGLTLGENTATVVGHNITVCLRCNRCKVTADLTLSGKTACTANCEKCSARITAAFRPSMLHHYSDVLGYLDLQNAVPSDLVLQDCQLNVGCLSCSQESFVQNLCYGQTKEVNCENCHGKLSLLAESARFQYIQPRSNKTDSSAGTVNLKTIRDPAVQKGKPLPEKGACKHYKQSHRWLRFPCCGRAYPCDVCHDEDQDHPMELASRMICGYCAKEQPYSNGKPCISCGSMMTRGAHTSHWEGGLGCRSKIKMSRNDRQKYANTNKTISKKASEKK